MSTESRESPLALLARIPEYLIVVLLSGVVMAMGTVAMASPTIVPALYLSDGAMVPYLIALAITGLVISVTQLVAKGDWVPDGFDPEEHPLSKRQMILISAAWYNVLVVTGVGLGLLAVYAGYAFVAPFVAMFVAPVDILLAKRLEVSPLTLVVAIAVVCVQLLYDVRDGGGEPSVAFTSSELVYVATGQRFREQTERDLLGRQRSRGLF